MSYESHLNKTLKNAKRFLEILKLYHRYESIGINHVPKNGRALLIVNHSLATYDGFLLGLEIFDNIGRLPQGLGDDMLFRFPFLKEWMTDLGVMPASKENAKKLLRDGHILGIAPGGMRESLRPFRERYQIKWAKRKGFVKLALETETPIILAACPAADRIFKVYSNKLTALSYKYIKFPMPIFKGFGPTFIPRPVKLVHYISEKIVPPKLNIITEEDVDAFHEVILVEMRKLMVLARNHRTSF